MHCAIVIGTPGDRSTLLGAFLFAAGVAIDTPPRILGVVSEANFERVVAAGKLVTGAPDAEVQTPPNLGQMGALTGVGHACRLKTGLLASLPAVALPPMIAASAAIGGRGAVPPCKVKLSLCLRQAAETEVPLIPETLITTGHARWERLFGSGKRPKLDQDDGCTTVWPSLPSGTRSVPDSRLSCLGPSWKPNRTEASALGIGFHFGWEAASH